MAKTISSLRQKFPFIPAETTVDHLVIGAGVVGLAVGRELLRRFKNKTTFVVERNAQPGQETSSRNSEVIHAGIYYPRDSLKTELCIRGRRMLYAYCRKHDIPHKKLGKLIIARTREEQDYLDGLYAKIQAMNGDEGMRRRVKFGGEKRGEEEEEELVPLRRLDGGETLALEPDLSRTVCGSLWSPESGIIHSHALIASLENHVLNSPNGAIVYRSHVVRIDPNPLGPGWVVQTSSPRPGSLLGERNSVLVHSLINCAGLNAHNLYNQMEYGSEGRLQIGFCKGSYYAYGARTGVSSVGRLIYPTPSHAGGTGRMEGLGTHLTLDMEGKIKFGPDVEWLDVPLSLSPSCSSSAGSLPEEMQDFWTRHLAPNPARLESTFQFVRSYLPGIDPHYFVPDYAGIRPKLRTRNDGKQDEMNAAIVGGQLSDFVVMEGGRGDALSLVGIESPGLTSALAIADLVGRRIARLPPPSAATAVDRLNGLSDVGALDQWA